MRATKSIPIVMAASADPVIAGIVASHAQPGGNVTGLSMVSTDTATKRLQLLRELLPSATRVAVLLFGASAPGPRDQGNALLVEQLRTATRQLGMSLIVAGIGGGADIAAAFATMARNDAQALIVQASAVTIDNRARIVELAATHRLPAVYEIESFVDAGGLLSYGPSLVEMYRRSAIYVDKILKGAKPASLPIEQPDKYDLVIHRKTARALGLKIPQALIVRADRLSSRPHVRRQPGRTRAAMLLRPCNEDESSFFLPSLWAALALVLPTRRAGPCAPASRPRRGPSSSRSTPRSRRSRSPTTSPTSTASCSTAARSTGSSRSPTRPRRRATRSRSSSGE